MSTPSLEELTDPKYTEDLRGLGLDEIRSRRSACQTAEDALSLHRRLVQGRLDIVQSELYRRSGGASETDVTKLVSALPDILVEHGDRHLGPGRLTSVDTNVTELGADFDKLTGDLDRIVDGARLSNLANEEESDIRDMADRLDEIEKSISSKRHSLHRHIDQFQEEIVRRYKSGEASVDGLIN